MYIRKKFQKIISAITVAAFLVTSLPVGALADIGNRNLAPWSRLQEGQIQKILYFYAIQPKLMLAESQAAEELLVKFRADALLLYNGQYLISKQVFNNDPALIKLFMDTDFDKLSKRARSDPNLEAIIIRVLRVVTHENIEKLLQIISGRQRHKYKRISERIFNQNSVLSSYSGLFTNGAIPHFESRDLYLNDIVARAFDIIFLKAAGVISDSDLSAPEKVFLAAIEPVINSARHSLFTSEFWDAKAMHDAMSKTLHPGYEFIPAANTRAVVMEIPANAPLAEKIASAVKGLDYKPPETTQGLILEYYSLKTSMIVDADQNNAEGFRLHYRQMLALLRTIRKPVSALSDRALFDIARGLAAQHGIPEFVIGTPLDERNIPDAAALIRNELIDQGTTELDARTSRIVREVVDEVTDELYDDLSKRETMREKLLADITTFHFANQVPLKVLTEDFSLHREYCRDVLVTLSEGAGAHAAKVIGKDLILMRNFDTEIVVRKRLKHEMIHYLSDMGEIRMPPEAESITFAVEIIEHVLHGGLSREENEKNLKAIYDEYRLPLMQELYDRGKELGLRGEAGLKIIPGVSDSRASYFSLKGLLLEARAIFMDKGYDEGLLAHPYNAQMAIAMILAGELMGINEKEQVKPFRLIRDLFNDLSSRYAPPDEAFLNWINAGSGLLEELSAYASSLMGQRIEFKKKDKGLWHYAPVSERRGEIQYVVTDLYPRSYDGKDEDDIEGKKTAVRERALAQIIFATSRVIYGKHNAAKAHAKGLAAGPEFMLLWDTLLTPTVISNALSRNREKITSLIVAGKYKGAPQWIANLFKDRYHIGNPLIERTLLTSLPVHLQFLDTVTYRWAHYDAQNKDIGDPRLTNDDVKQALTESFGTAASPGWSHIVFEPTAFDDEEKLGVAVTEAVWPAYERLYKKALKTEERKEAYERMLGELRKEREKKAFAEFTEEQLKTIDDYFDALPEDIRQQIKDIAKEKLEQAMRDYMNNTDPGPSMPFMEESQKGMGKTSQGQSSGAEGAADDFKESLGSLKDKVDGIERKLKDLTAQLDGVKDQTGRTKEASDGLRQKTEQDRRGRTEEIEKLAGEVQQGVTDALQKGREVEDRSKRARGASGAIGDGLPNRKQAKDLHDDSAALSSESRELRGKLEDLQDEANDLRKLAEKLSRTLSNLDVDESHVKDQASALSNTASDMSDDISTIKDQGSHIQSLIQNLENQINSIEKAIKKNEERRPAEDQKNAAHSEAEKPGETPQEPLGKADERPGRSSENQGLKGEKARAQPQDILPSPSDVRTGKGESPQGLADIVKKFGSELPEDRLHPDIVPKPLFNREWLDALQAEEAETSSRAQPLNAREQVEYDEWFGSSNDLIAKMTDILKPLIIPTVGMELETHLSRGTILKHLVDGVMGGPAFARRHEHEPLAVKITLMIDRSGSMSGDAIKYAALTAFTLLNVIFNLNDELEQHNFKPIEFEVGLYDENDELQISHKTVAENRILCRERLIYNVMKKISASGNTNDVKTIGRYVTRLKEAEERTSERSRRMLFSIGDGNPDTGDAKAMKRVIKAAEENGIAVFGVSVGDDAARKQVRKIYGEERSITPRSFEDLPRDILVKFADTIAPPKHGMSWLQFLSIAAAPLFPLCAINAAKCFYFAARAYTNPPSRELKPIEGYRHFFIEKVNGRDFTVFKKDGLPEEMKWERGLGGPSVPTTKIPDIDANEDLLLQIIQAAYRPDAAYTREGRLIELTGEAGLGKGEVLRAAAHIMNEELFFVAGNEDMDVEDLTERTTLGVKEAGRSDHSPSILNHIQHYGGWVVLDEMHKVKDKVINSLKTSIASKSHLWRETDAFGAGVNVNVPDHPRARVFATSNPRRAGIHTVAGVSDQAMLRRKTVIKFSWLPPDEEAALQMAYAEEYARENGVYTPEFAMKLHEVVGQLVRIATKERLSFAGYSASQVAEIFKDWKKLDAPLFVPANQRGLWLKRPPSPRVLKSIIKHFVLFPQDIQYRKWSVINRYYNFDAENDKQDTYARVRTDFAAEGFIDTPNAEDLVLDENSFKVESDMLKIIPAAKDGEEMLWDAVWVPLHPDAEIRKGVLPESAKVWIRSKANARLLYEAAQALQAGRHLIFVGEQETGKSTLATALAELLSGPRLEIQPINFQIQKEDLTYMPNIGEDGKAFQSGFTKQKLPRAMDDNGYGKILIMEETSQGRPGVIALLNEVSERGYLLDKDDKRVETKPGFAMIHTINPPTKDFSGYSFSDEFLERHVILKFDPLTPEESYGYLSDESKIDGFQVHPRLIGETVIGADGRVVKIDGKAKWSGILGVEQYIRRERAKDETVFPRSPGVGTLKDFIRKLRDYYEFNSARKGKKAQEVIWDLFVGSFTLEGDPPRLGDYHKVMRQAFKYAGLWTDEDGKDAVEEYLRGEAVITQKLPILREPKTENEELDRMLKYIQESTRGTTVTMMLKKILDITISLYEEDGAWDALSVKEQFERIYTLKEIYYVADILIKKRGEMSAADAFYLPDDLGLLRAIKENIQVKLLIQREWPNETLDADHAKDELVKRCANLMPTGDLALDRLLSKIAVFQGNKDYAPQMIYAAAEKTGSIIKEAMETPYLPNAAPLSAILAAIRKNLYVMVLTDADLATANQEIIKSIDDYFSWKKTLEPKTDLPLTRRLERLNAEIELVKRQLTALPALSGQVSPLDDLDLEKTSGSEKTIGVSGDIKTALSNPDGVSYSPDGNRLAIANYGNNTVSIIDLTTNALLHTIGEDGDIKIALSSPYGVSYSPDGNRLAIANYGNNTVSIIDLTTNTLLHTIGEDGDIKIALSSPYGVSYTPDGNRLAIANWNNSTVSIIDLTTNTLLHTIGKNGDIKTALSSPEGVSYSPDGNRLAIANWNNSTVSIIDLTANTLLHTIGEDGDINIALSGPDDVSYSPDGNRLTIANYGNDTVSIIDLTANTLLHTIGEDGDIKTALSSPYGVSYTPDGNRLAIANWNNNTVSIIDLIAKKGVRPRDAAASGGEAVSKELERLRRLLAGLESERQTLEQLAGTYGRIAGAKDDIARFEEEMKAVTALPAIAAQISPPGAPLDLKKTSGSEKTIGVSGDIKIALSNPDGVSYSPDGNRLAIANWNNSTVSIIDLTTNTLLHTIGEDGDIKIALSRPDGVSFTPDGNRLAIANWSNNTVSIIDLTTNALLHTIGKDGDIKTALSSPDDVSFTPDGLRLAIANYANNTVSIIDLTTNTLLHTIGEDGDIKTALSNPDGVSFTPDGLRLAITNWGNNTVSIIDLATNALLHTIGEDGDIKIALSRPRGVSFTPDGLRLTIANWNSNTVSIIDLAAKTLLHTIGEDGDIKTALSNPYGVSFTPDGLRLAITNWNNNTVSIIDLIAKKGVKPPSAVGISAKALKKKILKRMPVKNVTPPVTQVILESPIDTNSEDSFTIGIRQDTDLAVTLCCDILNPALEEGRKYVIRYNKNNIPAHYIPLLKEYLGMLNMRFPKSKFKLLESSVNDKTMFRTECLMISTDKMIGNSSISVEVEEGSIDQYFVKVVGIVNMSIAAATIGDDASADYARIRDYIIGQYKSVTGGNLALTGVGDQDLDIIRNIRLVLPRTCKIDAGEQFKKNESMLELLKSA